MVEAAMAGVEAQDGLEIFGDGGNDDGWWFGVGVWAVGRSWVGWGFHRGLVTVQTLQMNANQPFQLHVYYNYLKPVQVLILLFVQFIKPIIK